MADTVVVSELVKSNHKSGFVLSNVSDGTGESAVTKVDISTLPGAPERVKISRLCWSITDGMAVSLKFDRVAPGTPAIILNGAGSLNLSSLGPIEDLGTGGTGDIQLTTHGAVANAGYTIELELEKDI